MPNENVMRHTPMQAKNRNGIKAGRGPINTRMRSATEKRKGGEAESARPRAGISAQSLTIRTPMGGDASDGHAT